jgi:hypothetical protein
LGSVWAQDIQVEGNGFVNSTSYKGVFVEISLPGSDNDKIQSFKVELFNEDDELIGTNTLKEAEKAHGTGLTSPFVVIPGGSILVNRGPLHGKTENQDMTIHLHMQ